MLEHQKVLGSSSCIKYSKSENYTDKLLILKADILKAEYRFGEYQYFLAKSGFGCDPAKLGTKVFGQFLIDGENTSFSRGDFLGIADEDQLPNWAKEKMNQIESEKTEMKMGGM